MPKLRVKITHIDATVVSHADTLLDDSSLPRVPLVRVFGHIDTSHTTGDSLPDGDAYAADADDLDDGGREYNACIHIHQVYPYVYIKYTGPKDPQSGMSVPLIAPDL